MSRLDDKLQDIIIRANLGDPEAQYTLAWHYESGIGLKKDYLIADKWLLTAAKQGFAKAQFQVGRRYLKGIKNFRTDCEEAIKWLTLGANQNCADAQTTLGWCFQRGKCVNVDLKQAISFYKRSAKLGDDRAQYNLGLIYMKKSKPDYIEAIKFFSLAAKQGNFKAQLNLGILSLKGLGVKKDPLYAAEWFRRAAKKGYPKAEYNLGLLYAQGTGVPKDELEAIKWQKQAAFSGYAPAQISLSIIYFKGNGVQKNKIIALAWLLVAEKKSHLKYQRKIQLLKSILLEELTKQELKTTQEFSNEHILKKLRS